MEFITLVTLLALLVYMWTTLRVGLARGKYKIEATYLGIDGDNVVLKRKKDGRELKVPIARLSDADQAAIKALQLAKPENPFDP